MPSSIRGTSGESLADAVQSVSRVLSDDDVVNYGMEAEVLGAALIYMKENPNATVDEAIAAGFIEWDL
jgi:hypothetical protein